MKELSFKLKTKSRRVEIEDDSGKVSAFELRELKAAARDKYMDNLSPRLILDAKGDVVGIKKFEGMHIDLLCVCMHDVSGPEPKLVEKETLKGWPSSTIVQLFQAAQELNGFRKPDERNSVVAKYLAKKLTERTGVPINGDEVEKFIEEADGKLFDEEPTKTDG